MDFALPPVGEGLLEVELTRWLVQAGEAVGRGQALMEVLSDKATMEVPAPFAGRIAETIAEPGRKIKVGEVVLRYQPSGAPAEVVVPVKAAAPIVATATLPTANGHGDRVPAAPSVRLMARKLGIDLANLAGSGPGGRILLDDVTARMVVPSPTPVLAKAKPAAPAFDFGKAGTRVKLVGLRRIIAEQMVASVASIPHYSYVDECDFSELVKLRTQLKDVFATKGVKLTYLPFVVKAVARALKEMPIVNATHDDASDETTLHTEINVGIAVAGPQGLIVPVIRDADEKDLAAIGAEIERLSADVRRGRVQPADLKGGTFTVTSIGSIGGLIATPIINRPEVGIMAMGKIVKRPVFDERGAVVPAEMGYLSFSFDHRILDGAIGALFGNAVIRRLHRPAELLVGWSA